MSIVAASLSTISAAIESCASAAQSTSQNKEYYDLSSPAGRGKTWQCFSQEEVLDDDQVVLAQRVFRRTQLADEYMDFLPSQHSARDQWLEKELEEAKEEKHRRLN